MTEDQPTDRTPVLRIRGLSKQFGATTALDNVDLEVAAGEVHALLGQNGSGKSTLVKILSGVHPPENGATVEVDGQELTLPIVAGQSRRHGIGFVHQDLALVGSMSILDNLSTDEFETGLGWRIRWRSQREHAAEELESFGINRDPRTLVRHLSGEERAVVALIRALREIKHSPRGVLVLDEPTAYLPREGVERLFQAIRATAASGSGVIFISHRFDEVYAVCDRLTVLRDGRRVGTEVLSEVTEEELMQMILGQELEELEASDRHLDTKIALQVSDLHGRTCRGVSLEVHQGEVVGVTGLAGGGSAELAELLVGAGARGSGRIEVNGEVVERPRPREMKRRGVVLLPSDRLQKSGVASMTVEENVSLPALDRFTSRGKISHRQEQRVVEELLERFNVRPPSPQRLLGTLSGGNQQKALLAKWLQLEPQVLILDEPTQGVDVGSRRDVFRSIRDVAQAGTGVVVVSTEPEDLAQLCDRVLFLHEGRVAGSLHGEDVTENNIVQQTYLVSGGQSGSEGQAARSSPA